MNLPARISFVTLASRDIERMARFYRQFGWPEAPSSDPEHVVFQCTNGVVLGLYGSHHYEGRHGPPAAGFRGFTLAVNVESLDEVQRAYDVVKEFDGVQDLDPPQREEWGGGFSFRDPEGNVWDVVWAEGSRIDERGGLLFP